MSWFVGKTVLVPIDFSRQSHEAVDTALELAPPGATIHAVHVAPDLMVMEPGVVWEQTTNESREKQLVAAFDKEFADARYDNVHFKVEFGDAGHGIVDYAQQIGADMIVMPSHGRTGFAHLFMGSVAERVVRLAHCPVLVLKQAKEAS